MSEAVSGTVRVNRVALAKLEEKAAVGMAALKMRAQQATHAIRAEAPTLRAAGMSAGVGALIGYLASFEDLKNNKYVKENWWLLPTAILALGYYFKRRGNPQGSAILAAGGAMLMQAYQTRPKTPPQPRPPSSPPRKKRRDSATRARSIPAATGTHGSRRQRVNGCAFRCSRSRAS